MNTIKTSFGEQLRKEKAKRLIAFSKKTERRSHSIGTDACEEILNYIHTVPFLIGNNWKKHEKKCEILGIRKAKRRHFRDANFASEQLIHQNATIEYHQDGSADIGVSAEEPEQEGIPKLSKRQIRYAVKHIQENGCLPTILIKRLRQYGVRDYTIKITTKRIINELSKTDSL